MSPTFLFSKARPIGDVVGDSSRGKSGLFAGHNLVFDLFILAAVKNTDSGSQSDLIFRNIVHVDKGKIRKPLAQLADPRLYELLPLLRHVIFGVLAEISEGSGLLDLFRQVVDQFVLKLIHLCPQLLGYFLGHSFGDYKPSLRPSAPLGILRGGSIGDRVYVVDMYNPTTDQARAERFRPQNCLYSHDGID